MALDINVESNISALTKAMDAFGKDQLPFAMAGALTATAFIVRNTIVKDTFPRSFDVKNKRFAGAAFRVDKANKRKLEARVFDRLDKEYLAMQESGGTKRPRGNNIAIPTDHHSPITLDRFQSLDLLPTHSFHLGFVLHILMH